MRILFLSPSVPVACGTEVRAFRFLEYLAKRHAVDLLAFRAWPGPPPPRRVQAELLAALPSRYRAVTLVPLPGPHLWRNGLCNAISEEPFQVALHRSDGMRREVEERFRSGSYDLVWVNGLAMAQYAPGAPAPTVLDLDVCASHHYLRRSRLPQHLPCRVFYSGEAVRALRYEARILPMFSRCLVSSVREREDLWQIAPRAAIQVVPDPIELTRLVALPARAVAPASDPQSRERPVLAFTGDLRCAAHRDAARYLCGRILPRVRRAVPNAQALIIGPGRPRFLRALARTPGVAVTGPVLSSQHPLAAAVVVVCPLRAEAGFPVQVVEAMACGKPAIASPLVVEGLGLRVNDPILIAESAAEFADRAVVLLRNPQIAESIGGRCRQLVLERFDIRAVSERLDEILGHLVPPRRSRLLARG